MSALLEHGGHTTRDGMPAVGFPFELALSARGEAIDAHAAVVVGSAPASGDPAGDLHPVQGLFSVNYFCRLASTIFAGSGRRESRSTTMTPVGRVGVACDVQSGVENALPRRCTVAPLLARVFHAAGAVHRLLGFRSIPAFRRLTVGGRGAAADPEHVPGEQAPRGISGGAGPCGSSGRRTQACSA